MIWWLYAALTAPRVAVPNLYDAAIVAEGVIYYNPAVKYLPRDLAAFVFAHEEGHLVLGHTRTPKTSPVLVRRFELAADCWVAAVDPAAARSARDHFAALGAYRTDDWHPTGRERAVNLTTCLEQP